MVYALSERRQVRVDGDEKSFVFVADPDIGKLTLREETPGGGQDVCRVTVEDREELGAFLEGLARVLGVSSTAVTEPLQEVIDATPRQTSDRVPQAAAGTDPSGEGPEPEDRDEMVERARARNPKAFAPWTPQEEQDLLRAHRSGRGIAELAKLHARSQRAIEMRLRKLGEDV